MQIILNLNIKSNNKSVITNGSYQPKADNNNDLKSIFMGLITNGLWFVMSKIFLLS